MLSSSHRVALYPHLLRASWAFLECLFAVKYFTTHFYILLHAVFIEREKYFKNNCGEVGLPHFFCTRLLFELYVYRTLQSLVHLSKTWLKPQTSEQRKDK